MCVYLIVHTDNVSKTELRCLNRAQVLYESLKKQLFLNDPVLLDQLLPTLIDTLGVFESSTSGEWCEVKIPMA